MLVMLKNIIFLIWREKKCGKIDEKHYPASQENPIENPAIENPNIVDIKSVIIEHTNTSHKLSKTIRQAEKAFIESF